MRIIDQETNRDTLLPDAEFLLYGEMIKGVVDTKKEILAIDADLHADLETFLLENGSNQFDLWGINLYPGEDELIEFDSMINIRPLQNNHSRDVEDPAIRAKIIEIVNKWIK